MLFLPCLTLPPASLPSFVLYRSQVRHDRRVGAGSAVRFLTDGVLMRQLQSDFLLRTYSIILLDEAHERSLNTDLLLGECQGFWVFLGSKFERGVSVWRRLTRGASTLTCCWVSFMGFCWGFTVYI